MLGSNIRHVHRAAWIWSRIRLCLKGLLVFSLTFRRRFFAGLFDLKLFLGPPGIKRFNFLKIDMQKLLYTLPLLQVLPVNPGRQRQRKPLLVNPA